MIKELKLWEFRHLEWSALSGGYKMRFELARTLCAKPKLLILDEPLANLDIKAQSTFLNDLRLWLKEHEPEMAIIVSSQHLYKIEEVADHLVFLKKGKCVYNGPMSDVGKETEHHVFEISMTAHAETLQAGLAALGQCSLKQEGQQFLVYTPKNVTAKALLHNLLEHDLVPTAFRDISGSTRQLFEA